MYEIEVNIPSMPKGAEVSIPGLGTYKNESKVVVSKEEADSFRAYRVATGLPDETLLQAFQKSETVTVTAVKDEKKEGDK